MIRDRLAQLNVGDTAAELEALAEGDPGRVERDLAAIARQAAVGAVDAYWFDFTRDVWGRLDPGTGELVFDPITSGDFVPGVADLLGQVAQLVLDRGGRVVAVRGADLGEGWTGPAVARLRY